MIIRLLLLIGLFFLPSCRPQGSSSLPISSVKKTVTFHPSKPVLPPPEPMAEVEKDAFLICLDAGHGGQDPGTRRRKPPMLIEKQLSLSMSLLVERYLMSYGYKVVMTRRKDSTVALPDRVLLAKKHNALVFVSLHFNWAKNTACRGVEIFYFDKKNDLRSKLSRRAAEKINRNIMSATSFPSRGVKHGNFCVIRETNMPAVLVEAGFFSNQKDVQLLRQRAHRIALAKAIAKGIDDFCRMER